VTRSRRLRLAVLALVSAATLGAAPKSPPAWEMAKAPQPLYAAETLEGELPIAAAALPDRGEDVFALRVRGDSMIGAHIVEGDLVLVRRQDSAAPNDIVVALVEGEAGEEATVKRYLRDGERVVLKPEHPTLQPIVVDPRARGVRIVGKVIGVVRGF